jgi:integrase
MAKPYAMTEKIRNVRTRQGATGERDYCLILLAFRHGMRISELLDLHYHDELLWR